MGRKWVVNASPLIVLGKLDQLNLLTALTESLVVPEAVATELAAGPEDDPAKIWLNEDGKDLVNDTSPLDSVVANWDLGPGESHVINWALGHKDHEAILDDLAARKCAEALSIPIRGTIGVLLLAKKEQLLTSLDPLLEKLQSTGFHIHPELLKTTRKLDKKLD